MTNSDFPLGVHSQFPYETKWNEVCGLKILSLKDLDQTIDLYFKDYETTQAEWLFDLCPYFGVIWPSTVALTKYLAEHHPQERSVLELGCGLAIPSLYLGKQGISVRATDFHPDVPFFLQQNMRENSVSVSLAVVRWSELTVSEELIIGSDILYDREQVGELLNLLKRSKWRRAIFVDPGRAYWERFVLEAKKDFPVKEFLFASSFFCEISR
jgi:predicted nicotinamide N-methyase